MARTALAFLLLVSLLPLTSALPVTACKLRRASTRLDVALGFPRISNRMRASGNVTAAVLFVDFSDAPAARTPANFFSALAPAPLLYAAVSRGALNLSLMPFLRTLRMSRPATSYSFATFESHRAYLAEAASHAAAAGFNFSGLESVVVMAAPTPALSYGPAFCAAPGDGFTAGGVVFENAVASGDDFDTWGSKWLNHEMAHTLGLVDDYAFAGQGPEFGFTGMWSLMGDIAGRGPEFFGFERWGLGWLADTEVACVEPGSAGGAGETVTLAPLAGDAPTPPGAALLLLTPANATFAVAAELRIARGYDASLPKPGVLVYLVNTALDTGAGALRVAPLNTADGAKLTATLALGESLVVGGVRVAHEAAAPGGCAVVRISVA